MVLFSVVVVDYKQFVDSLDRTVEWLWQTESITKKKVAEAQQNRL
jgi:hypothetical protein